jgi:2-(1,2-epoxy-1,2-dihydrophenyl)acetyl-CoA isomerase
MTADSFRAVEGLGVALEAGVLRLTLDRPDKRNALSDEMIFGLVAALTTAATDEDVRVIVLDGAGDHFCGGADIFSRNRERDVRPRTGSIQRRLPTQAHRLVALLLDVQAPVVCKVRGWAAGIGFSFALASDFAVAAEDAKFWEPFITRGFTPDSGATWLLPRRVGVVRARELLLLGRELSGAEAAAWGAIHAAVPGDQLDGAVEELVARLGAGPTVALGLAKWLLHAGSGLTLDQHLSNEAFALELSSRTDDFREGMTAFGERRPPEFRGR